MLAAGTVTLPGVFASELSAIVAGGPAKAFGPNRVIAEGFPGGAVNCQRLEPPTGCTPRSVTSQSCVVSVGLTTDMVIVFLSALSAAKMSRG
jgi:hypothetical protein